MWVNIWLSFLIEYSVGSRSFAATRSQVPQIIVEQRIHEASAWIPDMLSQLQEECDDVAESLRLIKVQTNRGKEILKLELLQF